MWIGSWALLAVATHLPPNKALEQIGRADWVVHFLAYLVVSGLGAYHLRRSGRKSIVTALLAWAVIYFGYAAADEWLQRFVSRTPSYRDWLCDVAGVVVATGIALAWRHRPVAGLSEPTERPTVDNVTQS